MRERDKIAGHAFISYVREDSQEVDRLQRALEEAGIPVWRDTADLWPGEDWRFKIRHAIMDDALVFIACFSHNSLARDRSYQNEELMLAIEELRQRNQENPWFIPARFDDCEIPDRDIGGGRTIAWLNRADLFGEHFDDSVARIVAIIRRILGRDLPEGVRRLVQIETGRAAHFERLLSEGRVTYEGEDRDWLLALTGRAQLAIDVMSVDGDDTSFEGGFWATDLGQRYLALQRDAANRGVAIRRLFVYPPSQVDDIGFQTICRMQIAAHIQVHVLDPAGVPVRRISSLFDFIVFDGLVSYETMPATRLDSGTKPRIAATHLVVDERHVQERSALFEELWQWSRALD